MTQIQGQNFPPQESVWWSVSFLQLHNSCQILPEIMIMQIQLQVTVFYAIAIVKLRNDFRKLLYQVIQYTRTLIRTTFGE